MTRLPSIGLVLLLAGCSSFGPPQAHHYYVLDAASGPSAPASTAAVTREISLLVAPSGIAAFYDTQQIAYSREVGTRDYYQFSSWTETPDRALGTMLLARLRQSGAFRSVASATSGVAGTLLLTTRLEEIYHDAAKAPGTAKVTLSAELSDPARRILIARKVFAASAPVPSFDAEGAVIGMRGALAAAVDDAVAWAGRAGTP